MCLHMSVLNYAGSMTHLACWLQAHNFKCGWDHHTLPLLKKKKRQLISHELSLPLNTGIRQWCLRYLYVLICSQTR